MNSGQIRPGNEAPSMGVPAAVRIGVLRSVPIHTAAATAGVKPAVHASLFSPSNRDATVPVRTATGSEPGSLSPSWRPPRASIP
ncbi:hypothetical protein [Pseudonocardia sp. GCM10023141]|uniref:hypothetical protein n=1 Tax=Pseudonocardia sp. GCM10023141 TaxID=3252653 RepID=UPI0036077D19